MSMWKKITSFATAVSMAFASPVAVKAENSLMNTVEKAQKLDITLGAAGARMHQDRPGWLGRILHRGEAQARATHSSQQVDRMRETFKGGWGI